MKHLLLLLLIISCWSCSHRNIEPKIVTSDLEHFWTAYDAIHAERDTARHLAMLDSLFLRRTTPGQRAMIEARNYRPREYLNAIRRYPAFWNSLRENTGNTNRYSARIAAGIRRLKNLYPNLTESTIYYTMGVFRSPGTGVDSLVLIGTEFALGDTLIDTSDFPPPMGYVKRYYRINPVDYLDFLAVHEYVHTQQEEIVNNLLSQVLYEGIAEWVAVRATGKPSPWPAFEYGAKNTDFVRERFEAQLFNWRKQGNWLWNDTENEFGVSDLGYYVGYTIADGYYRQAEDKEKAIAELIELDYNDEPTVERVVDASGYLSAPLATLYQRFEDQRPKVVDIHPFDNGSQTVDPDIDAITITFSEPLSPRYRSTGYGPLGEDHFPEVHAIDFAAGGRSVIYQVTLEADKQYQLLLESGYRTETDNPLQPYLVEFKTRK